MMMFMDANRMNSDNADHSDNLLIRKTQNVPVGEILKLINCVSEPVKENSGETVFRCIHCNRLMASKYKPESKAIHYDDFQQVLAHQKNHGLPIQEILVKLELIKEEDIVQELISLYGFPYLPLNNYDVSKDAIEMIPYELAKRHCAIPIEKMGEGLTVAMANPLDTAAINEMEKVSRCMILPLISTISEIKKAIDISYKKT